MGKEMMGCKINTRDGGNRRKFQTFCGRVSSESNAFRASLHALIKSSGFFPLFRNKKVISTRPEKGAKTHARNFFWKRTNNRHLECSRNDEGGKSAEPKNCRDH